MTKQHKLLSLAACMSAALVASSAMAAETPAAQTSAKEVLPRTLEGYVSQDKAFWDYLKANHPYFKYLKEGRVVGKFTMSDREEEWVDFGGGDKYREDTGRTTAVTYRLPYESFLDLPNNFVGPKKCGECHPSQYEKWERSRHNKIVRFPEEMTEAVVQGDLKRPLYGSKASVLPEGINVEDVYVLMGTPRTKYGFVDKWLVRGTYHIEDGGNLSQATGKIVAGGNQFSRNWAEHITPEVAKKINAWDPTFPTKLEDFGAQSSKVWGMNSYGASNRKQAMFQPGSSYCEICHTWKFDFKSQDELFAALGDGEKLRAHTIAKGVSCEECHGAGAHLYGARGAGMPSDCE
ncbi:multiheme c-type cytochrome, partial [Sutterella wadsworthensis]